MSQFNVILLVLIASVVVSLSPLSISVFLALMAGVLGKGHDNKRFLKMTTLFLATFTLIFAILGLTLIRVFNLMATDLLSSISIAIAVAAIVYGIVSIKDYFWYDRSFRVPEEIKDLLHSKTMKQDNYYSAINLGAITAFASLASTGLMLLTLGAIVSFSRQTNDLIMIVPAICLALPLITILVLVTKGVKISALIKWKEDSKPIMRLESGLIYIILGWILLLILNGSIGSIL